MVPPPPPRSQGSSGWEHPEQRKAARAEVQRILDKAARRLLDEERKGKAK